MTLYFDCNATRPLKDASKTALKKHLDLCGNSSSIHQNGRLSRQLIEEAREKIAKNIGIVPKRIIFTSGATEANNAIIKNFNGRVLLSAIEHDSIYQVRPDAVIYNVSKNGVCDLNHLEDCLKKTGGTTVVSLLSAHNETGIIQPVEEAFYLSKKYKAYFHTDAVQGFGRQDAPWHLFDFISFSGHKIGAASGVGGMVIPDGYPLIPLIQGGGQERSYRSGTENILGIITLGAVIDDVFSENWDNALKQRNYLEKQLKEYCESITVIGRDQKRLANTSLLTMPGVKNDLQVMNFDLHNICVSAGSACSSGKVKNSRSLKSMGLSQDVYETALRVSLLPDVKKEEIDHFVDIWKVIFNQCQH